MAGSSHDEHHAYRRYQAVGNDYIVMGKQLGKLLSDRERIRRLCDRHIGLGSDGILLVGDPPPGFGAAVRILNPDGSEAEKSGNGVRIFAKYCFDHVGLPTDAPLRIHTLGGPVAARLLAREATRSVLSVTMGHASFRCEDLPMTHQGEWIERDLECGDRVFPVTCVSMGNPHAVIYTDVLDEATVRSYGAILERHPRFPNGTNVQFARVADRGTVDVMIWERGAGWTLSSGSSSCAVVAAGVRTGKLDEQVRVRMPGGELQVTVGADWQIEQIGPVQEVMSGIISPELVAELGAGGA